VALKLLLAGCNKADRERLEPMIEGLFSRRPAAESWMVSLVRIGERWSVSLDGPDARLRGVTFMSDDEGLRDRLQDTLRRGGFASEAAPPPSPPAPAARPAAAVSPAPVPAAAARAPTAPSPAPPRVPAAASPPAPSIYATPAAPPRPAPAPAPPPRSAPGPAPAPAHRPGSSGEMRDRIQCEKCDGSFVVVYDLQRDEPLESVPVACPHCWHLNRTMVGQYAATGKEYRAEKIG